MHFPDPGTPAPHRRQCCLLIARCLNTWTVPSPVVSNIHLQWLQTRSRSSWLSWRPAFHVSSEPQLQPVSKPHNFKVYVGMHIPTYYSTV